MKKKIYSEELKHIPLKEKVFFSSGEMLYEVTPNEKQLFENAVSHEKYVLYKRMEYEDYFEDLFASKYPLSISAENAAIYNIEMEELHKALNELDIMDRQLIDGLFFYDLSERKYSDVINASRDDVHHAKERILKQLRIIIEKV